MGGVPGLTLMLSAFLLQIDLYRASCCIRIRFISQSGPVLQLSHVVRWRPRVFPIARAFGRMLAEAVRGSLEAPSEP